MVIFIAEAKDHERTKTELHRVVGVDHTMGKGCVPNAIIKQTTLFY